MKTKEVKVKHVTLKSVKELRKQGYKVKVVGPLVYNDNCFHCKGDGYVVSPRVTDNGRKLECPKC